MPTGRSAVCVCCAALMTASTSMPGKLLPNGSFNPPRETAIPWMWKQFFGFHFGRRARSQVSSGDWLSRASRFRRLLLLESGIDGGIGADFIIGALGPPLHREILRIDTRHAAFADHNSAEDV